MKRACFANLNVLMFVVVVMAVGAWAQTSPATSQASPSAAVRSKAPSIRAAAKSPVDDVIEMTTTGTSEAMIIDILRGQGKTYNPTSTEFLKMHKAGVSDNVIKVMMDPRAAVTVAAASASVPANSLTSKDMTPSGAAPTPAAPPPAAGDGVGLVTPFPADLPNIPAGRKRRVIVSAFQFSGMKDPIQAYFHTTDSVGQGLRALLMSRLQKSNVVTVLDRSEAVTKEQITGQSTVIKRGTQAPVGGIWGADCVITGDITKFGRDDKTKRRGIAFGQFIPHAGIFSAVDFGRTSKAEKAVVGIDLRMVDAETSAVLDEAEETGESQRKSTELGLGGLGIGGGGAGGGAFTNAMSSSNFQNTILGEATVDAIDKIAKKIEESVPKLPAKPRSIEGHVAQLSANGLYLAIGGNDGVLLGDRFAILQVTNTIIDPQTKEAIDVEATKVGEFVASEVRDKMSVGAYGGQPLSKDYIALPDKGYIARLMSK